MLSCYHSKLIIYVWLWMLFRRFVEAFTPIQNFTLLLDHSLCLALAFQVILEWNRHMTPERKQWRKNSQWPSIFNYSSWKILRYSILEAWKTTIWLSAHCRNCTGKIGLWWLCLRIMFLVCLPRPNVPDKCSTQRRPTREVDCTI